MTRRLGQLAWAEERVITRKRPQAPPKRLGLTAQMGLGRLELPTSRLSGGDKTGQIPAECRDFTGRTHDLPPFPQIMPEYAGIYRHTNRPKTTSQTGQRPSKALTIPTLPSGWEPSPPGACTCPPIPRIGVGARLPSPGRNQPIHLPNDSTGLRILVGTLRRPPKRRAWRSMRTPVISLPLRDSGQPMAQSAPDSSS